jgi:hypothetical protein
MTRRVDFKLNIDEITPRKKDVRKAITELRKSNKIPKRGYKSNIIGIIEEFGLVTLSLRVFISSCGIMFTLSVSKSLL